MRVDCRCDRPAARPDGICAACGRVAEIPVFGPPAALARLDRASRYSGGTCVCGHREGQHTPTRPGGSLEPYCRACDCETYRDDLVFCEVCGLRYTAHGWVERAECGAELAWRDR